MRRPMQKPTSIRSKNLTQDLPNDKGFVYFQDEVGRIIFSDYVQDINKFSKKVLIPNPKMGKNPERGRADQLELTGTDIIAKLILNSKNIKKKEFYHSGFISETINMLLKKIN
jgi:DNA polymerase-3 subunit epsilon